jgi:AcrR family transcriptional regulator
MTTLSRKQTEVRERERRFLDVARKMLIDHGFAGLNMDDLAKATQYSKGTVYGHFCSKEDLVTALAIQSMEQRLSLFDRASRFVGLPREQMLAIGVADELFVRLHPTYFRSELVIKMAEMESRVSPDRRETIERLDQQCFSWVLKIIESAIARGDLCVPAPRKPSDLVFAVFSLAIGTSTIIMNFCPLLEKFQIADPFASYRENAQVLLDGFGWKPLRAEWDYAATYQRIAQEIFPDECERIGLT